MTGQPEQKILIIAGPNGAGKTTFAKEFLPELAISRVKQRVALGGHAVPDAVVRRRYASGWRNFTGVYRQLVDEWALYDNTGRKPQLLEEGANP